MFHDSHVRWQYRKTTVQEMFSNVFKVLKAARSLPETQEGMPCVSDSDCSFAVPARCGDGPLSWATEQRQKCSGSFSWGGRRRGEPSDSPGSAWVKALISVIVSLALPLARGDG